jgi:NAD(P)-dependent dehydrogenase (short-subunit alcohol dehydrogenase family)
MRRLPVPNIYGNLFSVAQKVVAITGAGQGIGLALAEGFAAAGANVVLVDLNAETLAQARTKVEKISKHVTSVMTDVSADGAPAKIVAASKALGGRVDCLINNAGIMSYTDSRTITDDEFDRMIKINLKAPIRIMKAVLYEMESQGSGSIINIGSSWSSRASVFNQSGGGVDYCSAKAALQAYTRGAAQNVAEKRIRVNAIAPGGVDTPMHAHHRDFLMEYEKYIPLGRMTVAEDLVGTAIFLASEASASRSQPDRVRLREQGRKQSARSSHAVCLPTW